MLTSEIIVTVNLKVIETILKSILYEWEANVDHWEQMRYD